MVDLVRDTGLGDLGGVDDVTIDGADPVLASKFPIGEAAATALTACGAVAGHVHAQRTGDTQSVAADVRHAAASLISYRLQRCAALKDVRPAADGLPLVSLYPCRDGRWFHVHGAYPRLAEPTMRVLRCNTERESVAAAVATWDAQDLEDALADAKACGAMVRTSEEWRAHEQGRVLGRVPRVELVRIGDAPPIELGPAERPLSGIRVLDLTRMLAGPSCGRSLAEHGAEVLAITGPDLHNPLPFVIDTGHGKRSAFLDLEDESQAAGLRELAASADVFVQGYRTGALSRRGFGPDDLALLRPGIVYVSINCYGHDGPFEMRPGWEQLAQSVSGVAAEQGSPGPPRLVPAAACDYITGYLGALGAIAAIARRAVEGGSWHVRVSLARTAMWFDDLGPVCEPSSAPGAEDPRDLMTQRETGHGRLTYLTPVVRMSKTPPRWDLPPVQLGSHEPAWRS